MSKITHDNSLQPRCLTINLFISLQTVNITEAQTQSSIRDTKHCNQRGSHTKEKTCFQITAQAISYL